MDSKFRQLPAVKSTLNSLPGQQGFASRATSSERQFQLNLLSWKEDICDESLMSRFG